MTVCVRRKAGCFRCRHEGRHKQRLTHAYCTRAALYCNLHSALHSAHRTSGPSSSSSPGRTARLWAGWARCGPPYSATAPTARACPPATPASTRCCCRSMIPSECVACAACGYHRLRLGAAVGCWRTGWVAAHRSLPHPSMLTSALHFYHVYACVHAGPSWSGCCVWP